MKRLIYFIILTASIISASKHNAASKNSNVDSDLIAGANASLYQKYLSKWIEFYTLFTLPNSFEALKTKLLIPKENPKFIQYKERLKNEVLNELSRDVNAYGSTMHQNPMAQPNLQLYSDQSYLEIVSFGSSDVYQNYLAKQNEYIRDVGDIPAQAIAEFKHNIEEADAQYKCLETITGSAAEKACDEAKINFLISKNTQTAKKYFELLYPITNKYVEQARRVYNYFASLVRELKVTEDKAVKFAVQSNATTVYNLLVSLSLIETCYDWYKGYLFEKPE